MTKLSGLLLAVALRSFPLAVDAAHNELKFAPTHAAHPFHYWVPNQYCEHELGDDWRVVDWTNDLKADFTPEELDTFFDEHKIIPEGSTTGLIVYLNNEGGFRDEGARSFALQRPGGDYHDLMAKYKPDTTHGDLELRKISAEDVEGVILCIRRGTPPPTSPPTPPPTSPPTSAPIPALPDLPQEPADFAEPTEVPFTVDAVDVSFEPGDVPFEPGDVPAQKASTGSSHGDPHFVTWSGGKYDFHGGCDLVLVHNPGFAKGLGMDLHIRTEIVTWWSYIKTVVLRVGEDTLEVMGSKAAGPLRYWINGVEGKEELVSGKYLKATISGFRIKYREANSKHKFFRIDFREGEGASLEAFQELVRVNVRAKNSYNFDTAVGLMGSFPGGQMRSRDNTTIIEDPVAYGKEWQVRAEEPKLFHEVAGVQHPTECAMPVLSDSEKQRLRRRLGESLVSQDDAEKACAHVDARTFDSCVYDVLATNKLAIAESYGYDENWLEA